MLTERAPEVKKFPHKENISRSVAAYCKWHCEKHQATYHKSQMQLGRKSLLVYKAQKKILSIIFLNEKDLKNNKKLFCVFV